MIKTHFYLLIVLVSMVLVTLESCDTNQDNEYPVIVVTQPLANTIYENGDTIRFQAVISDNVKLNTVEISLVDKNNKPVLSTISVTPGKNPFTFNGEYIIDDPLLPFDVYQLRFRAMDAENITNHFVEIQIHELDRIMLYPLIVTHPEAGKWVVYKLANSNLWKEFYTHTGDYCGSAINSAASQLYMCGIYQSGLTAIGLADGVVIWNVKPGFNNTERWFENISFSYPKLYASCTEGNIRGYDKTGVEIYKSDTYANEVARKSVTTKNFIVGSFTNAFSNGRYLAAFHNTGGLLIYSKFIEADVAELIPVTGDKVLVFANKNGQGEILMYNGADNSLLTQHPFYEGTFREAATMDSDNYIISTSAGLFWYHLSINSLTPFVTKIIDGNIACDATTQLIYASSGKTLEVYTFPFASLAESYSLPDTAVDLHLVFNK